MEVIGIELSDAGILAAAGDPPRLLPVDGEALESPGYALMQTDGWVTGQRAAAAARRFPHRIDNRFWQRLGERMPAGRPAAPAEIAGAHLAAVLHEIGHPAANLAVAVPSDFSPEQAGELTALVSWLGGHLTAVIDMASACRPADEAGAGPALHLDIGLHRTFGTGTPASDGRPVSAGALPVIGQGVVELTGAWARAVADAFVRATRFDPFYRAADEQALHDRLPSLFERLRERDDAVLEIASGLRRPAATISARLLAEAVAPYVERLLDLVGRWRAAAVSPGLPLTLRVSHRLARLPVVVPALKGAFGSQLELLPPGAAALGVLSRVPDERALSIDSAVDTEPSSPTHLLYRDRAYPLTATPLSVGRTPGGGPPVVCLRGNPSGVSRKHCVLQRVGARVAVEDTSRWGTFLDGRRIEGRTWLKTGQTLRLGSPGEELRLITVLEAHETPDG